MDKRALAIKMIKACGLNVTPQRVAIYEYLMASSSQPDAETIYKELGPIFPGMSLATVYKTLETFVRHNLIRKLNPLNAKARYEPSLTPHQHLICEVCGKVIDIGLLTEKLLDQDLLKMHDFTPNSLDIHIFGLCGPCRGK